MDNIFSDLSECEKQHSLDFNFKKCNDNERILPYSSNYHKLYFLISGKAKFWIEGKLHLLSSKDILLLNSNSVCSPIYSKNEKCVRIVIYINPLYFKKINYGNVDLSNCFSIKNLESNNFLVLSKKHKNKIWEKVLLLLNIDNRKEIYGYSLYLKNIIESLILNINYIFFNTTRNNHHKIHKDSIIDDVINYVNKDITKDFSLDEIASDLYLNTYCLTTFFKKNTGINAKTYINKKKIYRASNFLKKGYSVNEASTLSGFGSYSNFVREFKKEYNITPKKYSINFRNYNNSITY